MLKALELCAGAGGQALGLEQAGFGHAGLFENDKHACETLRKNRPHWPVFEHDLFLAHDFSAYRGIDLLAGGLPCPPFSVAGKQLGEQDERNLFTRGVEIAEIVQPKAIMFENVRGMLDPAFQTYREKIELRLKRQNYAVWWTRLNASNFGVPQLRPRVVMVALKRAYQADFKMPLGDTAEVTVGDALFDLMIANGWEGAEEWRKTARKIAPTIVGGSKKHGGPDLGPTRSRKAWLDLGVDGKTIGDAAPEAGFKGVPKLTVRMAARLQGFPDEWQFQGKKTSSYRQVGNAFPPPVARAVGESIAAALRGNKIMEESGNKLEAAE